MECNVMKIGFSQKHRIVIFFIGVLLLFYGCSAAQPMVYDISIGTQSRTSGAFDPGVPIVFDCEDNDLTFQLTARHGSFTDLKTQEWGAFGTVTVQSGETVYWNNVDEKTKDFDGIYECYVDVLILRKETVVGYACIMMHPNEQHSAWTGTVVQNKPVP